MSIVLKPYSDAAAIIQNVLQKTLADKPVVLLLSGGSATKLYQQMTESLELSFSSGRLHVSLVDERWNQNPKHADANDVAIRASGLITKLEELGAEYHPILHGGSLEEDAATFNQLLGTWAEKHVIITILGIGLDGHTAGILPGNDADSFSARFDGNDLAVGYHASDTHKERITTTFPLLRQAAHSFLVAPNEDKEPILKRLLNPEETDLHVFPAKILFEMNDVTVMGTLSEEEIL